MKENMKQPWFLRRAAYAIVGVVLLALAGFGLIEEAQIDAIAASPVLGALVAFIASAKTHSGSDSTATADDVAAAAAQGSAVDPASIAASVVDQINTYGRHAADQAQTAVNEAATSVAEYYNRGA